MLVEENRNRLISLGCELGYGGRGVKRYSHTKRCQHKKGFRGFFIRHGRA
jgi:hypothetical protein